MPPSHARILGPALRELGIISGLQDILDLVQGPPNACPVIDEVPGKRGKALRPIITIP